MKWFHNATIGKFLAVGFAVAVHGIFALGAYFLGLFISGIVLHDAAGLQQPTAIFFGILTFAGAMWSFVYMEYAREDVDAYSQKSGKNYRRYLTFIQVSVGGDELASLAFRCYMVADWFERLVVGVVGILFLVIAFCLGKVIHAMANRPFEVAIQRARQDAGRALTEDAAKMIGEMSAAQKLRFYQGDPGVIDEIQDTLIDRDERKAEERETKKVARTRKLRERENQEHERDEAAAFTDTFLRGGKERQRGQSMPTFLTAQDKTGRLSQNGNGNGRNN